MGHLELSSRSFALRSGVREDADSYATCVQPDDANLRRKGALALLVEPAGDHPSLADEACKLAEAVVNRQYFSDTSVSLTTSLLAALDSANRAVLEHDHTPHTQSPSNGSEGGIAVQGGGVRTRGAKVGVTAVLFRPDGGGVYLAQLAPTQAYIVHNGAVQALPEPSGWNGVVEVDKLWGPDDEPANSAPAPTPRTPLPAQSLGSTPGIVVDLIYRRVEAGDLVVLVSPGLARHLDRETAERIFIGRDADSACEALYEIAQQHTLARAHASVIGIGATVPSTASAGYGSHHLAPGSEAVAANGGSSLSHKGVLDSLKSRLPALNMGASRPKEWAEQPAVSQSVSHEEPAEEVTLHKDNGYAHSEEATHNDAQPEAPDEPQHPTATLLQHTLDVPPYRQPIPLLSEAGERDTEEETAFTGWEDLPPALGTAKYPVLQRVSYVGNGAQEGSEAHPYLAQAHPDDQVYTQTRIYNIQRLPAPPPAHIEFGDDLLDDAAPPIAHVQVVMPQAAARPRITLQHINRPRIKISPEQLERGKSALRASAKWSASTLKSLMPERAAVSYGHRPGASTGKRLVVPRRTVIVGALVVVAALLLFSMSSSAGSRNQKATINYLQEAKQADLLANQPGITDAERRTHLTVALDKAQQALLADPQSVEAKRLVAKEQSALDKAEGVTRLKEPKLLFDLGKAVQGTVTNTLGVSSTFALNSMVLQSDDAYLFDKAGGRIYRCKLAAQSCAPVLASGDSAGGEKVGILLAMTMRVGNLVALDDKLTAYIFNTDNSAWQAQPLGDAAKLQKPKDVATYDGNLYLLDAKPGQVSKYGSGAYGAAPVDWLKDPASVAQVKDPVAIGIDGVIYVLLGDGKVLAMQGGKVVKAITPAGAGAVPATDLYTSTDVADLYLLRADGTITRVSKEGQTLATLKPAASQDGAAITGMAVDEGRGKVYLLKGQFVYEAILPGRVAQSPVDGVAQQPLAKPTVEP